MDSGAKEAAAERYRAYLNTLARIHIDPRLRAKFGWSDVVQTAWLEAYLDMDTLEQLDEPARRRRLYRVLVNTLRDRIEYQRAKCRDVGREVALALDASSVSLGGWLAVEDEAPGAAAEAHRRRVRVMEAVALLPDREREALVLLRFHGWKQRQVAEHLGCTTGAVAGLHARALERLRAHLGDLAEDFR